MVQHLHTHHPHWTDKNHTVGAVFFLHTLMIADLMIGFEIAAHAIAGRIRLMEPEEILSRAPEATRRAANPLSTRS